MKKIYILLLSITFYSCTEDDEQGNLIYDELGVAIEIDFVNQNTNYLTKDLRLNIHLPEDLTIYNGQDSTVIHEYNPDGLYKVKVELMNTINRRMDYTLKIYGLSDKRPFSISSFFLPDDQNLVQFKASVTKNVNSYSIVETAN